MELRHPIKLGALALMMALPAPSRAAEGSAIVQPNEAPYFLGSSDGLVVSKPGRSIRLHFRARDPEGEPLFYSAQGLPEGASLDPKTGALHWRPPDSAAGLHTFSVTASDGARSVDVVQQVRVIDEWKSFALPGVRYSSLWLGRGEERALLHGIGLELLAVAWIHRNENRGPSHGRVYLAADLVREGGGPLTLLYAIGMGLSLERNPERRWLVPYFGLETGGLTHSSGHAFHVTPLGGVHLWSSRNLFVNAQAGFLIVPRALETLGGWKVTVGVNAALW